MVRKTYLILLCLFGPGGGREKGQKWTFLPITYFIFNLVNKILVIRSLKTFFFFFLSEIAWFLWVLVKGAPIISIYKVMG